jgi:hypothetical protein
MSTVDLCLRQIDEIRQVASGAEVAYVARSRVGRLVLNVTRLAAARDGMPLPDKPGLMVATAHRGLFDQSVIASCNRILDISKTITQPSEPLDERWRSGWATLLTELDELEMRLRLLEGSAS